MSSRYDKDEMKFRAKKYRLEQKYRRKQELKNLKPRVQFTKIALFFICLFVIMNCTAVEVFAMVSMFKFYNLDALPALISAVVTESLTLLGSFVGYLYKSYSETRESERIRLERDKMIMNTTDDDESVG